MEGGGYPISPAQSSSADQDIRDSDANGEGTMPVMATAMGAGAGSCMAREQDRLMPITNIVRIMRNALPTHAKISDDTKETIQGYVSEFIAYVTAMANERCHEEQRKTVTSEDVLCALGKLGFHEYAEYLNLYMNRYHLLEGNHRPARHDVLFPIARGPSTTSSIGLYAAPELDMGTQGYPARFFPDEAGSSSAVTMPQDHHMDAADPEATPSQGPQLYGFKPFARYE